MELIKKLKILSYIGLYNKKNAVLWGLMVILCVLFPVFVEDIFYLHLGCVVLLNICGAVSWNLIAKSGQFSFGHAAFWAIGAYTSALLSVRLGFPFWSCFLLSCLFTGILGMLLGGLFIRAIGIFFTLLTFAASEIIRLAIINWHSITFGMDGVPGIPSPVLPLIGIEIATKEGFYWLLLGFTIGVVAFLAALYRSPWGIALDAVRENQVLAESTGLNCHWYKIFTFGLGCAIVGLAGSLHAFFMTYISPSGFTFWKTVDAVVMNVVGGVGTLAGPIIGSIVMSPLPEFLRGFAAYQVTLYGLIIVVMLRFIPGGLMSLPQRFRNLITLLLKRGANEKVKSSGNLYHLPKAVASIHNVFPSNLCHRSGTMAAIKGEELLKLMDVSKYFGGLTAVDNVELVVKRGEILGIIGPNGAGKSTLFNLITGFLRPNKGRIYYNGQDITGLPAHQISRLGIGRAFQASTLYTEATVWLNVIRGNNAKGEFRWWRSILGFERGKYKSLCSKAEDLIIALELDSVRDHLPSNLPYGLQRKVQIAIALATEPEIILLDEPVSGMNPNEAAAMSKVIKQIRETGVTVVLVEHNVDFVMNLAERIVVLDHGEKIAEGLPAEIRKNQAVIEAYLGTDYDLTECK